MSRSRSPSIRPDVDFAVIGGGIVGLATALSLTERFPDAAVTVLEKEGNWGAHQTGHNSGVIHSGIYYPPGSLKARLTTRGRGELLEFCRTHDIPHEVCGKIILATGEGELDRLDDLFRRGRENGLHVRMLTSAELRNAEPHARGVAAVHVPETGIVDFGQVARAMARVLRDRGAQLRLGANVRAISEERDGLTLRVDGFETPVRSRFLVNCGGLHSDRIATLAGVDPPARIVPFRGEYYELRPEARNLVQNLIYPVPDPAFPFLGVHFTRGIDGSVHCGPNAVLGFKREGYRRRDVEPRDITDYMGYGGFWRFAARNVRAGFQELARSASRRLFTRSLQRLVPDVRARDLVPATAGVRAQALGPDGSLVDDFLLVDGERSLHVLNAPSPAATASLAIGAVLADRAEARFESVPADAPMRDLATAPR